MWIVARNLRLFWYFATIKARVYVFPSRLCQSWDPAVCRRLVTAYYRYRSLQYWIALILLQCLVVSMDDVSGCLISKYASMHLLNPLYGIVLSV